MQDELWTESLENLLVSWAEKASGYAWLHQKSVVVYKKRNLLISIPAAVFSYVSGVTVLLFNDIFEGETQTDAIRAIIGIIGIIAGVLSNFQEMFTFKEEAEKHRIANHRFLSFFREISCELSLEPKYRSSPIDYITVKRFELDKILEQSPDIPVNIINEFNVKFKNITIHKPDPVIGLQTILPFGQEIITNRLISLNDKILLFKCFSDWKIKTKLTNYKKNPTNDNNDVLLEIANSRNSNNSRENEHRPRFLRNNLNDTVGSRGNIRHSNLKNEHSMSIGSMESPNQFTCHNSILSDQKKLFDNQNVIINWDPILDFTPESICI
mgnify:CR=1 FL=1|jgi:hypothetical protein